MPWDNQDPLAIATHNVQLDADDRRRRLDPARDLPPNETTALKVARSTTYCRQGAILVISHAAQAIVIVPTRCKLWRCPTCGPILARQWQTRIAAAKPTRFMTLTCDPAHFPTPGHAYDAMKAALPKLVRILRQRAGAFEYAATWELHESGYPHLHLLCKGVYLPKSMIRYHWNALGIGYIVHIRQVDDDKQAAWYVTKYVTKTLTTVAATIRFTRLIQVSRGFLSHEPETPLPDLTGKPEVIHTRHHLPEVMQILILQLGFTIQFEEDTHRPYFIPPSNRRWDDLLAVLHSRLES